MDFLYRKVTTLRTAVLGVTAAALLAPASAPAATGELHDALSTAQRHASTRLGVDVKPSQTYAFRSEHDSDWVLVDGYGTRTRPWAVFLQRGERGWVVRAGSTPPEAGPAEAPCDIRIPFSESAC
jgi:hypothetical protein